MRQRKPNPFLIAFVKLTGWLPALLFFKPKLYYMEGAPRRLPKPCILMSNHTSLMDFVLYLLVFWYRNIRFLMAEVLFRKGRLFSWFLFALGGIFVNRDARDFSFVGNCLESLDAGGTLGIFPQGRLPVGGKPFPFAPSTAYIALHTDAPIIPVYTDGCYGLFRRAHVMVGAPIDLKALFPGAEADAEGLRAMTEYLEERTRELKRALVDRIGRTESEAKPSV